MITIEKLRVFVYYKGDVDAFGHGRRSDRKKINDSDFYLINNLLSDLFLINNNLASKEYVETTQLKIKDNCEDDATIEELKRLSNNMENKWDRFERRKR